MPLNTKRPRGWLFELEHTVVVRLGRRFIANALSAGHLGRWARIRICVVPQLEPDFAPCDVLALYCRVWSETRAQVLKWQRRQARTAFLLAVETRRRITQGIVNRRSPFRPQYSGPNARRSG